MRILTWDQGLNKPNSGYRHLVVRGLEAAGHQVIALDSHALAAVFGLGSMQRIILAYARAYRPQLALVMPSNHVEPRLCDELRALGIRVVSFRFDDCMVLTPGKPFPTYEHLRRFCYLDGHCDLAVTSVRSAPAVFAGLNLPVPTYHPLPIEPKAYPTCDAPKRPVIAYAGSAKQAPAASDSWRVQVIKTLVAAGLPVELHHDTWQGIPDLQHLARPTPPLPAFQHLLGTSLVNLAIGADWEAVGYPMIRGLHLEIAACGGMLLCNAAPELGDLFRDGVDIATYDSLSDLIDKARYFLAHPDEAAAMGQRARKAMEAKGGWNRWLQHATDVLAAMSLDLDWAAPALEPDRTHTPLLSLVATTLGHVFERHGDVGQARHYYAEALRYEPQDYAANTGLARLAATAGEALPYWRTAARHSDETLMLKLPAPMGLPGVDPDFGTAFRLRAAFKWAQSAYHQQDWPAFVEAVTLLAQASASMVGVFIQDLESQGATEKALQLCEIVMNHDPEHLPSLLKLGELLAATGRFEEAQTVFDQAAALQGRLQRQV